MNIAERAQDNLDRFGDYDAVIEGHRVWRNRDLFDQASRLASVLTKHIQPGDRILVVLPGSRESLVAAVAIWRAGGVLICLHPTSPANEVRRIAQHSRAVAIITAPGSSAVECAGELGALWISTAEPDRLEPRAVRFDHLIETHEALAQACPRSATDVAQLTYTSGTTGTPKAVVYTHGGIAARSMLDDSLDNLYVKHHPSAAVAQDVLLTCLPPTAFAGLMFHVRLRSNTKLVILERFDPALVLSAIQRHRVTRFAIVPSMGEALLASPDLASYDCTSLRELMISGAYASPALLDRLAAWLGVRPFITYGLTEAGGPVAATDPTSPPDSVGRILPGTAAKICDETGREVPDGEVGEIVLKTPWMAAGYLDNPEATAAVFVDGWVRTGDRGCLRDGHLSIAGRIKELIIQAGVNIVPHEVADVIAALPGVAECAVVGVPQPFLGEEAVACVVRRPGSTLTVDEVLGRCQTELDARKVPARVRFVDQLPRTPSGKLQLHVLRDRLLEEAAATADTELVARLRAAQPAERVRLVGDVLEHQLVEVLRSIGVEPPPGGLERDGGFGDQGLSSIGAVWFLELASKLIGRTLPDTATFRYPSLTALSEHIVGELFPAARAADAPTASSAPAAVTVTAQPGDDGSAIAIIGVACRVPGAATLDALWDLLLRGSDTVSSYPEDRDAALEPRVRDGLRASYLPHAGRFDAQFFGYPLADARSIDPQHRLALELTWDALEDAGCNPWSAKDDRTGMFLGLAASGYPGSSFDVSPSMAAARISQFFNLRGPVVTVDTACSSSLVALHHAVHSLRRGEAERAIVGGVNIIGAPEAFDHLRTLGVLSADGRCKSFDASADGFGQGEGGVVLVLERLDVALARGRLIHALVRGTAINHDGRTSRLTAPNPIAQEQVIESALRSAGVTRDAVQYVEAHATGTTLGDPAELEALHQVFAGRAGAKVAVGSIKSNIGHLSAASGLAGVVKVVLALKHRRIPASRHVRQPTPRVSWSELALQVQAQSGPWPAPHAPLIAGVTSLAFSGTNAHVVLEEAPGWHDTGSAPADGPWVLALSARTPAALRVRVERVIAHLESESASFRDVAYTASCHRAHLECRVAVVASTHRECIGKLREWLASDKPERAPATRGGAVFVFPNVVATSLARELVEAEPVFRATLERCQEELGAAGASEAHETARRFAVQVGLAALWRSLGVAPATTVGSGLGEIAAAYTAGYLSLGEAAGLVVRADARADGAGGVAGSGGGEIRWLRASGGLETAIQLLRREGYQAFVEVDVGADVGGGQLRDIVGPGGTVVRVASTRDSMLEGLAALYAAGCEVDLSQRFAEPGRIVELPGYPWQGEHHWTSRSSAGAARPSALVHQHVAVLDGGGQHVFETELDAADPSIAYLLDHRRDGVVLVPPATWISMAWASAQHVHGARAWGLRDLQLGQGLELVGRTRLQLVSADDSVARARFGIYARAAGATVVHARGVICHSDRPLPVRSLGSAAELRRRCTHRLGPEALYQRLLDLGIEHGPAFQALAGASVGDGELIAALRVPAKVAAQLERDALHPSLLESCLSAVQAARADDGVAWSVAAIRELSVYASTASASSVIVRRKPAANDGSVDVDLWILDPKDGVLAQLLGVRFTPVATAGRRPTAPRRVQLSIDQRVRAASGGERAGLVHDYLVALVASVANVDASAVTPTTTLTSLGIESLLSMQIVNRLESELAVTLTLRDVLTATTIDGLARIAVGALAGPGLAQHSWPERGAHPVLSSAQLRLWFMHRLAPEGAFDNVAFARRFRGRLDPEALRRSIEQVVARHEALRTVFPARQGVPYQHVMPAPRWELPVEDLRADGDAARAEKLDRIARETELAPFELDLDLPIRTRLVRTGELEHVLFVTIHHVVADAVSVAIFWREVAALYNAERTGGPPALEPLPVQLADYAAWERARVESELVGGQLAYWKAHLDGVRAHVDLPTRGPRPAQQTFKGKTVSLVLPPTLVEKVRSVAAEHETSVFIVLLAAYRVLIGRYAGEADFCLGWSLSNRAHADAERLIGMFINMLPIRTPLVRDASFRDLVLDEKQHTYDAYENKDAPFESIVEAIGVKRDPSRNPLFQIAFASQNTPVDQGALAELETEDVQRSFEGGATFDLMTWVWGHDAMSLRFIYNPDLFAPDLIERMARDYERIVTEATAKPSERIATLQERIPNPWMSMAITATFTAEPLLESLTFWADKLGLRPRVELAPYNQVFQQLLDPTSALATTDGVGIVVVRVEDWIRDLAPGARIEDVIAQAATQLIDAVREGRTRSRAATLVCVCPLHEHADTRLRDLYRDAIERIRALDSMPGLHVITAEEAVARYGVTRIYDPEGDELGHVPFTAQFFAAAGAWLASKVLALVNPPYKVLVLDCDNTLWKGVLGEDGADGIGVEEPYLSIQRFARAQRERGMLLATCSRNEHADVEDAFKRRRDMALAWDDFVAHRINWERKADNLRSLAEELNVGLDSFIFVDDDDANCADVRQSCPGVLVLQVPRERERIQRFLDHAWGIERLKATDTDRQRTEMYHQQRQRTEAERRAPSLDQFLDELGLEVTIAAMADDQLDRVAQLLSRTNQFNTTTRRLSANAIQAEREHGTEWCTVEVRDRFGSYGLTGVVALRSRDGAVTVSDFLLSCRVLGKKVEHTIVEWLATRATALRCDRISFEFAPTAKNGPARVFLDGLPGERTPRAPGFTVTIPATEAARARRLRASPSSHVAEDAAPATSAKRTTSPEVLAEIAASYQTVDELMRAVAATRRVRAAAGEHVAPRTPTEELLVQLWASVLGIDGIGIHDDFFALGGTSLKSVQLASLASEEGLRVTPRQLQEHTTIAGLAAVVEPISSRGAPSTVGASREPRFGGAAKAFAGVLDEVRAETNKVSAARASVGQAYFWYLEQAAPDPFSYAIQLCLVLEGTVDVAALKHSVETTVARHTVYRTQLVERDGVLHQVIPDHAPFEVEVAQLGAVAEDRWSEHFDRAFAELVPGLQLAPGRQIRARLLCFGRDRYALFFVVHHGITDGAGHALLMREILDDYAGRPSTKDPVQFVEYSEALTRYRETPAGRASRDKWRDYLRGAPPVEMPVDFGRAEVDAKREAIRAGVTPDRMHFPYLQMEMPATARDGAIALASDGLASPFIVYLSALAWMLHRRSGQRDICIQTTYDPRGEGAQLAGLLGPATTWKVVRIDLRDCGSLHDAIASTTRSVLTMNELGPLPEFFELVPHPLRRMVFNYIPVAAPPPIAVPGVMLRPQQRPFPKWMRPWDLHLTMFDRPNSTAVFWTGNDALFGRRTIERLLAEYFDALVGGPR